MKKFYVKGTRQARLDDRLANAKVGLHTDLRSMEAKIYRIANMTMHRYFQDKLDRAVFRDLQKMIADMGFTLTFGSSYMEAAHIINQYVTAYPDDEICVDLVSLFLHPLWRFASMLYCETPRSNDVILKQNQSNNIMKNFHVWMDDYLSVLQCIFPDYTYQQSFYMDISSNELFTEEQLPMLLEFVFKITNDSDELNSKWPLLLKFMIDPFDQLYNEYTWEYVGNDNIWESL